MTIGQRIKARRKELDMSAEQLANKLGKSRATIFRYENGDIKNLPLDILTPIAEALATTPAYLMGWGYGKTDNIEKSIYSMSENMGLTPEACDSLIQYAKMLKYNKVDPIYYNFYNLGLTNAELHEVYQYAQFIINKRG